MPTQTTHTPGPWSTRPIHGNPQSFYLAAPSGELMAEIWATTHLRDDVLYANAKLIAAAPELLAALQHLMRYDFGDSEGAKEARAAIAKATGQP
jgi:hypothetical protein